jgi:beta-lactamase regulating signal transducer with metallopeptidase domain
MGELVETGLSNAALAAVLAVIAAAVSYVCRRPALTHALWLLVLLKLVTPPLIRIQVPWLIAWDRSESSSVEPSPDVAWFNVPAPGGEEGVPLAELAQEDTEQEPSSRALFIDDTSPLPAVAPSPELAWMPFDWKHWLACGWFVGCMGWFSWIGWSVSRFHRLMRVAWIAPSELQTRAQALSRRLGLSKCPAVWLVPGTVSPMLWALGGTSRLLFPARLLEHLDHDQQAALLLHELAHFKRRDHWVRFLELAAIGLYWWNPVVWWARREIREAEEQCCDAWVVWASAGAGRAYALALLQTVAFFSHARPTLPATASGIGQVSHLRRRLTMIMQGRTPPSLSWVGCCAILGSGLALLPLLPVQAEPPRARGADNVEAPQQPAPGVSAGRDNRDRQIEALKNAVRLLEDQKRAEDWQVTEAAARGLQALPPAEKGTSASPKADAADIKKAQAEVETVAKELAAKQQEFQEVHRRFQEAVTRLARLTGGTLGIPPGPRPGRAPGAPPAGAMPGARPPVHEPRARGAADVEQRLERLPGARPPVHEPRARGAADVEQRLERLLQEVEELRRDIRQTKPAAPGTPASPPTRRPQPGRPVEAPPTAGPALPGSPALPRVPGLGASPALPTVPPLPRAPAADDAPPGEPAPAAAPGLRRILSPPRTPVTPTPG